MESEQPLVVVMGASSGAVETLSIILPELAPSVAAPIVIVVHLPASRPSMLPDLFAGKCAMPVKEVEDKEALVPGCIYFAPPGYHVLVERDDTLSLDCDLPVNFSRPSIDVLFESAAKARGSRVIGVLLTGSNQDGARGLAAIRAAGGLTIAQDPATAEMPLMPAAGIAVAHPDHVLAPKAIADLLVRLLSSAP